MHRLDRIDSASRLPYSLKVLLENLARNEDGQRVTADQVSALAAWDPGAEHGSEIQYTPARVLLQDFTGVPCVVDLVAMRDAAAFGGDPRLSCWTPPASRPGTSSRPHADWPHHDQPPAIGWGFLSPRDVFHAAH